MMAMIQPALADTAPAAASSPDGGPLDIVVTATRRLQRQQDVPLAVTAYSAEDVVKSGYKNPTDLQYMSPSIQVSASGGVGFNVRGVGTNSFNAATEQTVGLMVDGVVYGFVDDIGADMSDVARVRSCAARRERTSGRTLRQVSSTSPRSDRPPTGSTAWAMWPMDLTMTPMPAIASMCRSPRRWPV
jgi:hypothetical protein